MLGGDEERAMASFIRDEGWHVVRYRETEDAGDAALARFDPSRPPQPPPDLRTGSAQPRSNPVAAARVLVAQGMQSVVGRLAETLRMGVSPERSRRSADSPIDPQGSMGDRQRFLFGSARGAVEPRRGSTGEHAGPAPGGVGAPASGSTGESEHTGASLPDHSSRPAPLPVSRLGPARGASPVPATTDVPDPPSSSEDEAEAMAAKTRRERADSDARHDGVRSPEKTRSLPPPSKSPRRALRAEGDGEGEEGDGAVAPSDRAAWPSTTRSVEVDLGAEAVARARAAGAGLPRVDNSGHLGEDEGSEDGSVNIHSSGTSASEQQHSAPRHAGPASTPGSPRGLGVTGVPVAEAGLGPAPVAPAQLSQRPGSASEASASESGATPRMALSVFGVGGAPVAMGAAGRFLCGVAQRTGIGKVEAESEEAVTARRVDKWRRMMGPDGSELFEFARRHGRKFKARVRKGVPDPLRGLVWLILTGGKEMLDENPGLYARLLAKTPTKDLQEALNEMLGVPVAGAVVPPSAPSEAAAEEAGAHARAVEEQGPPSEGGAHAAASEGGPGGGPGAPLEEASLEARGASPAPRPDESANNRPVSAWAPGSVGSGAVAEGTSRPQMRSAGEAVAGPGASVVPRVGSSGALAAVGKSGEGAARAAQAAGISGLETFGARHVFGDVPAATHRELLESSGSATSKGRSRPFGNLMNAIMRRSGNHASRSRNSSIGNDEALFRSPGDLERMVSKRFLESTELQILKDVHRTFPNHIFFSERGGRGQKALYNVLKAAAYYDTEMGYVQGMGFVAGMLLLYMPEEEAFWSMMALMKGRRTPPLRGIYSPGFPLLQQCLFQLEGLLHHFEPKVAVHMHNHGVTPGLYATQWFMTLFGYCLPPPHLLRSWDVILHRGLAGIFAVALAILKIQEPVILAGNFEGIVDALSAKGVREMQVSPGGLMEHASRYPRLGSHLRSLQKDYVKHQVERMGHA